MYEDDIWCSLYTLYEDDEWVTSIYAAGYRQIIIDKLSEVSTLSSAAHRALSLNKTLSVTYIYSQSNHVITSYPYMKLATGCVQHQPRRKCSCVCWKMQGNCS